MAKTCVERIEDIDSIDTFRAIVTAVGIGWAVPTFGASWIGMEYAFPDPTEYAAQIEGAPSKIAAKAETLGPNSGDDWGSTAALYEKGIRSDLGSGVPELDKYWGGEAADEFVSGYLVEMGKHLLALSDACESHMKEANKIEERIIAAHDAVVEATRQMVRSVIKIALSGSVLDGAAGGTVAVVGSAATGGLVAVAVTATLTSLIIGQLVDGHSKIQSAIDALNSDLGTKLTNSLEGIERREIGRKVDRFVSKAGWSHT